MKGISNIQVLRGLAAVGVVVAHAQGELVFRDAPNPLPNLDLGVFGVDLFFVISGFVMAYASAPIFGSLRAVPTFVTRRIVRIVPLYYLATVAFALLLAASADGRSALRAIGRHTLQSFAFLPSVDGLTPVLPTGWTLNVEMAFYLCFALVLPFRRRPALMALGAGLAAVGTVGTLGWLPERLAVIANLQVLEFVAGLAIAEARLSGARVPAPVACGLAAVAFAIVLAVPTQTDPSAPWRGLVWGPPAALIVGGFALVREAPATERSRIRRGLERMGDASYAIYLTHYVANWAILPWLFVPLALSGPRGALAYFFILLAADAQACWLVYRYVERPLTRRLNRFARADASPPRSALAPA